MALSPPVDRYTSTLGGDSTMGSYSPSAESALSGHGYLGEYFHPQKTTSQTSLAASLSPSVNKQSTNQTMYQSASNLAPPASAYAMKKKIRSQYPRDSEKNHVEFILVASFDIDRGSIMEHQYPTAISGDDHTHMLAELMLPDQAHNRSEDWTVFFLHRAPEDDDDDEDGEEEGDPSAGRRSKRRRRKSMVDPNAPDGEAWEDNEGDEKEDAFAEQPLIYVLNLVNTKHDSSVKRGAIVKAMAICTRHPFLHIYKPLLLLALDEYFKKPVPETLVSLFDAVNLMDLSLMPRLSLLERNILQSSTAKDLFIEKFQQMIEQRKVEDAKRDADNSPKKLASDGAPTPTQRYALPRDTHEFETRVVYNGISVPVKVPTARSPETVGDFSIIKLIQTFSAPHSQSPQPFALHPHLTTNGAYTHPIIVLVNALLTQKRVMFIGHNRPSGEVAEAVLASCALASGGLLKGFTRHAFPYTDLTKIDDLLTVPGFVAGVTNPAFANKPEWWDLLCDLPSGRIKISNKIEHPETTEGIQSFSQQNPSALTPQNVQVLQQQDATGDGAFMDNVLRAITNRLGEGVIRTMWRDWIFKLVRIAAVFEETVYGASALYIGGEEADAGAYGVRGHGYVWSDDTARQKEMASNVNRIEGWRNTRSYYSLIQDMANLYVSRPISSIDLHHHHDRLRTQKLSKDDSAAIYLALERAIQKDSEICQLLTVTPESHGGLFYVALGLFHPKREIRYKTVELLERIKRHEAGRHFWEGASKMAKLAFFRIKREAESGSKREDDESSEVLSRTTTQGE